VTIAPLSHRFMGERGDIWRRAVQGEQHHRKRVVDHRDHPGLPSEPFHRK
jgi:hypothetical protein